MKIHLISLQFDNFFFSPQIKEESVVRLYDVGRLKADEEDFEDMDDDDDNPDGDDDGKINYLHIKKKTKLVQICPNLSEIVQSCLNNSTLVKSVLKLILRVLS